MFTNKQLVQPIYYYIFILAIIAGITLGDVGQSYHKSVKSIC